MIVGLGTDIVEIARIEELWRERPQAFARRVFTDREVAYCRTKHRPAQHLAARFAAKEAALKALGTGWAKGIGFQDVEVCTSGGAPTLCFHGAAQEALRRLLVHRSYLSYSHADHYATAVVILERDGVAATQDTPLQDMP